jgi:predicted NodU family carbamoyl transferase
MELRVRRGHAVLVNTSFNEKGLPILNRVSTAFALFDGHDELGGLLIEDWWFKQPG